MEIDINSAPQQYREALKRADNGIIRGMSPGSIKRTANGKIDTEVEIIDAAHQVARIVGGEGSYSWEGGYDAVREAEAYLRRVVLGAPSLLDNIFYPAEIAKPAVPVNLPENIKSGWKKDAVYITQGNELLIQSRQSTPDYDGITLGEIDTTGYSELVVTVLDMPISQLKLNPDYDYLRSHYSSY
jgi:hypothetical protein